MLVEGGEPVDIELTPLNILLSGDSLESPLYIFLRPALSVSRYLIAKDQLLGASYSACLSYSVATIILVAFFLKENKFSLLDLLRFKKDFELLKRS